MKMRDYIVIVFGLVALISLVVKDHGDDIQDPVVKKIGSVLLFTSVAILIICLSSKIIYDDTPVSWKLRQWKTIVMLLFSVGGILFATSFYLLEVPSETNDWEHPGLGTIHEERWLNTRIDTAHWLGMTSSVCFILSCIVIWKFDKDDNIKKLAVK